MRESPAHAIEKQNVNRMPALQALASPCTIYIRWHSSLSEGLELSLPLLWRCDDDLRLVDLRLCEDAWQGGA